MQIEKLKLKNFRCYDALEIDFEPKLTVIVGETAREKLLYLMHWPLGWSLFYVALISQASISALRMCAASLFTKRMASISKPCAANTLWSSP